MDSVAFKRILATFVDRPSDLDVSRGQLLVEVRDELIEARIFIKEGAVHVEEAPATWTAEQWFIQRIARIPLLAERILSFVAAESKFVMPSGSFLDQLENAPNEEEIAVHDAIVCAADVLNRQPAGTASVLYLTADAGEGKTTVISQLARLKAEQYRQKKSNWLLVPITLGGRSFLRLDDVIVAGLVNRLRFPLLYYESFLELVRMGVLVPALDGFEEMFVEGSAGEAVSALGNLIQTMESSGAVLVAARKAYFEYKRLETQARLFDALAGCSVAFSRLALKRWDRGNFLEYGAKREVRNAAEVYDSVSGMLGATHPLLTRAVLVKKLFDVASETTGLDELLSRIRISPTDYFAQFVRAIITREAREKWIDLTGDPPQPLLSEQEHHELLALI